LSVGFIVHEVRYFVDNGEFIVTCEGAAARNLREQRAMAAELIDEYGFEVGSAETIPDFSA
jgi:hypothetical protein